jgi:uncharacterized membrane protein
MRKSYWAIILIIIVSFASGIYLYPQLPEKFASHWNAAGEVDGYMPRFWGLFLMPLLSAGLFLLFVAIPRIDPLKHNIEKFRKYYDGFVVLIILFLFYMFLITIAWNFGYRFDITQLMAPALGVLFYYAGILTENAKMNWFIGIRTPWTLSNEKVWDRTHKLGGKLFKASGIITVFGAVFQPYAFWLIIVPVLFTVAYTIVYSYFEYQKETRQYGGRSSKK